MSEILTLAQTHKLDRRITVLLYGESYWKEIINFDALVRHGMINQDDMDLFRFADDPQTALALLTESLVAELQEPSPAFATLAHLPQDLALSKEWRLIEIQCIGAARQVTGSKHVLRTSRATICSTAASSQGRRKEIGRTESRHRPARPHR